MAELSQQIDTQMKQNNQKFEIQSASIQSMSHQLQYMQRQIDRMENEKDTSKDVTAALREFINYLKNKPTE